jgi:ribosomal protein S19
MYVSFMYSTYFFLFQLSLRKKSLLKLREPQRIRLFFVIRNYFKSGSFNSKKLVKRGLLRQKQLRLLSIKVYRSNVHITGECVGLPLSVYSGNIWRSLLVKKNIVGYPLCFFILLF